MSPPDGNPLSRISATRRFDPWNSSATGHQRADTQPGTEWRHSRTRKLNSQFGAGDGSGGKRLSDTWGAGAEDAGAGSDTGRGRGSGRGRAGRMFNSIVQDGSSKKSSFMDMLARPGLMRQTLESNQPKQAHARDSQDGEFIAGDANLTAEERLMQQRRLEDEDRQKQAQEKPHKLFDGVTVYVNGSTFPLVSDHRLKQLISENGGNMSLNLGRRKVTHVILGRPNGSTEGKGLGGGLAATKLEKEIRKIGGCGVKFVSVEWVLQSLQEGRRLPEARFSNVKMAAKAQNSVYGLYTKHDAAPRSMSSDPAP
ncbi:hypothetical protein A9Z42_0070780 [Trichoderma parareesei]|uniref:BRCT domain-containing protein n=1 Tax=Trichoderma parareesei TaxID=858221 RepID=A0A2H2ZFU0_TRIPA|nr:hypothetical protein A9Z42_0070780 [Trichoderma parareesei]